MEGIKQANQNEIKGYNKTIKNYRYGTGTIITVLAHENPKIKKNSIDTTLL